MPQHVPHPWFGQVHLTGHDGLDIVFGDLLRFAD